MGHPPYGRLWTPRRWGGERERTCVDQRSLWTDSDCGCLLRMTLTEPMCRVAGGCHRAGLAGLNSEIGAAAPVWREENEHPGCSAEGGVNDADLLVASRNRPVHEAEAA